MNCNDRKDVNSIGWLVLISLAVGLTGCAYLKQHWLCLATGCMETRFEPAPNMILPVQPSTDVELFYNPRDIPWPYRELGTITAYATEQDNGQDAVEEIIRFARRFGGDGLLLPESMKGCSVPHPARNTCGLQIPLHAKLLQRLRS